MHIVAKQIFKSILPALLTVALLFVSADIFCQSSLTMTEYLSKRLEQYTASVPREDIYIHTDRNEYISGENLWFSTYLFDRKSMKPGAASSLVYIELLNSVNRPVIQKKIYLQAGKGEGQFQLPDTLGTGLYTLRAYTSWMKNFLPDNCFMKELSIYNSFSNRNIKRSAHNTGLTTKKQPSENQYSQIKLSVDNTQADRCKISVIADNNFRETNNSLFYLIIQAHGNIIFSASQMLSGDNATVSVPRKQLSPGVNQITIFDIKGQPVADRLIFSPVSHSGAISIDSPDSISLRSLLHIKLDQNGSSENRNGISDLSVSVVPFSRVSFPAIDDYLLFGTEFGLTPEIILGGKRITDLRQSYVDSILMNLSSNWINWKIVMSNAVIEHKFPFEKGDHFISGKVPASLVSQAGNNNVVVMTPPGKTASFQYSTFDEKGNFRFNVHIDNKIKDLVIQPDFTVKGQPVIIESPFSDQYLKQDHKTDTVVTAVPAYISEWSVNHQVTKIYGTSYTAGTVSYSIPVNRTTRFYGKPDIAVKLKDYIALPVMQEVFFELLAGVSLKSRKNGYEITIVNPDNNRLYDSQPGLFIDGVMVKDASLIAALDPEQVERIEAIREKYCVGDYLFQGVVNVITKAGDFSNVSLPDNIIRIPYRIIDPELTFAATDYSKAGTNKKRVPDFRNTMFWNPDIRLKPGENTTLDIWSSDYISEYEITLQGVDGSGNPVSFRKKIKVSR